MQWLIQADGKPSSDDWVDADAHIAACHIINEILIPGTTFEGGKAIISGTALHKMAQRIDAYAKGWRPT